MLLRRLLFCCFLLPGFFLRGQDAALQLLAPLPPDSLLLRVCQLDSTDLRPPLFTSFAPLNDNLESIRFRVDGSNDPSLLGKTIDVLVQNLHFRPTPLYFHKGWTGEIKVIRNWTRAAPFRFYWFDGFPEGAEKFAFAGPRAPELFQKPFEQAPGMIRLYVEVYDSTEFPIPISSTSHFFDSAKGYPTCRFKVLAGQELLFTTHFPDRDFFQRRILTVFVAGPEKYEPTLQKGWKGTILVTWQCETDGRYCGYYLEAIEHKKVEAGKIKGGKKRGRRQ